MQTSKSSSNRAAWWRRPVSTVVEFWVHVALVLLFCVSAIVLSGCSGYSHTPMSEAELRQRQHLEQQMWRDRQLRRQELRHQEFRLRHGIH